MTPAEAISLIQAAQAAGVSSLKFGGLEASFVAGPIEFKGAQTNIVPFSGPYAGQGAMGIHQANQIAIQQGQLNQTLGQDQAIKHKIEEMKSVMQLDDGELMERMFPSPKDPLEELANGVSG